MPSPALSTADHLEIAGLFGRFFRFLDGLDDNDPDSLFADEASVDMGLAGRPPVEGRVPIAALFAARPAGRTTRHVWSGLTAVARDDHRAEASCQVVVYQQVEAAPARATHVCDTSVVVERDGDAARWLFTSMKRAVIFVL